MPWIFLHTALALAAPAPAARPAPARPVHTYSIVARDPATGNLGVAVQSHYFSVGGVVPWAESGVGAVATQSFAEPAYGPRALGLMKEGLSAPEALARLVAADAGRDVRQVGMVDAAGRAAGHTGLKCIDAAGHVTGPGYSVQANIMDSTTVWGAMSRAYEEAVASGAGDLADHLLVALDAAEREGGDLRGKQSAALLVVRAEPSAEPWTDRLFDLRVEDHPEPLVELRRLVRLQRAYRLTDEGDKYMAEGRVEDAAAAYAAAGRLDPGNVELKFWQAATLWVAGDRARATELFSAVFASPGGDDWRRLVPRLVKPGLLPDDRAARDILEIRGSR